MSTPENMTAEQVNSALDDGLVVRWGIPSQSNMYIRKVADVGDHAYEVAHPQSETFIHGSLKGKLIADGIIYGEYAVVREIVEPEVAKSRGVFEEDVSEEVSFVYVCVANHERPVVADSASGAAEKAAEVYDLPVSALDLESWSDRRDHWKYTDGKVYRIYEREEP